MQEHFPQVEKLAALAVIGAAARRYMPVQTMYSSAAASRAQ